MNTSLHRTPALRLKIAMIAFFVLVVLSLFVVYTIDPSIYLQSFMLAPSQAYNFPWQVMLFLVCLLAFISVLVTGVLRQWRWIFWLMLIAFSASILDFPVTFLQISGVLPQTYPLWYSLFRLAVAAFELVLAVWMIQMYRREGVWAMGKKRPEASF